MGSITLGENSKAPARYSAAQCGMKSLWVFVLVSCQYKPKAYTVQPLIRICGTCQSRSGLIVP